MGDAGLADAIEGDGKVMLSRPTFPGRGGPFGTWGVFVGSHGGQGKTLIKAIRACLMCCGIGVWWKTDYGEGELLRDFLDRACREHLGRPIYRTTLTQEAAE